MDKWLQCEIPYGHYRMAEDIKGNNQLNFIIQEIAMQSKYGFEL